jgi:hypothetical protein
MTPEELDNACADEAERRIELAFLHGYIDTGGILRRKTRLVAVIAARLAREGYTPPEPVDPDVLAYREWAAGLTKDPIYRDRALAGEWDNLLDAKAFVAGARMAREREQERVKVLLATLDDIQQHGPHGVGRQASATLKAYKDRKEAAR